MIDVYTESLLQEIATEMAFLMPSQPQGLGRVAEVLTHLSQAQAVQKLPDVQQDVVWSIALCQQGAANPVGLAQDELEALQRCFERLSNVLYMAKPLTPTLASVPETLTTLVAAEPANSPQALDAPKPDGTDAVSTGQTVDGPAEDAGFVLGPDADLELLNEFCTEGRDLLHQVEQGVLVLEDNPKHKDTLNQVFRAFHTFKGARGFWASSRFSIWRMSWSRCWTRRGKTS